MEKSEIQKLLEHAEGYYRGENGVHVSEWGEDIICATGVLPQADTRVEIELMTREFNYEEFIKEFKIQRTCDLDKIKADDILGLHWQGKATLSVVCKKEDLAFDFLRKGNKIAVVDEWDNEYVIKKITYGLEDYIRFALAHCREAIEKGELRVLKEFLSDQKMGSSYKISFPSGKRWQGRV